MVKPEKLLRILFEKPITLKTLSLSLYFFKSVTWSFEIFECFFKKSIYFSGVDDYICNACILWLTNIDFFVCLSGLLTSQILHVIKYLKVLMFHLIVKHSAFHLKFNFEYFCFEHNKLLSFNTLA